MKKFLNVVISGLLALNFLDSQAARAPVIPKFDLSDLKTMTTESKASEASWSEYQAAMTTAFDKTKSFVYEDGVPEFKLQAANRFLEIFGQVDNPYSTLDDHQLSVVRGFHSDILGELVAEEDNEYSSGGGISASTTPTVEIRAPESKAQYELARKISPQCAYVFAHCAAETMLGIEPIKIADSAIRFEPQLTKVETKWYRLVEEAPAKTPYSGLVKGFLSTGQLTTELNFDNGILAGPYNRWWPNGAKAVEAKNKKGFFSGLYKEWYDNGQLRKLTTMKKGIPVKKETLWYLSGIKKAEISLSNRGALNGKTQAWYPDGQLYFEGRFAVGTIYKEQSIFYPNGQLAIKYSPLERVKCIGRRMQTNCPTATMMTIKKKAMSYDRDGLLVWSSKQEGLTRWDFEGEELEFIPNTIEQIL